MYDVDGEELPRHNLESLTTNYSEAALDWFRSLGAPKVGFAAEG